MVNKNSVWVKVFIGFGVLVVISGIYSTVQKDYVGGIAGVLVGLLIVWQNIKKGKDKNSDQWPVMPLGKRLMKNTFEGSNIHIPCLTKRGITVIEIHFAPQTNHQSLNWLVRPHRDIIGIARKRTMHPFVSLFTRDVNASHFYMISYRAQSCKILFSQAANSIKESQRSIIPDQHWWND